MSISASAVTWSDSAGVATVSATMAGGAATAEVGGASGARGWRRSHRGDGRDGALHARRGDAHRQRAPRDQRFEGLLSLADRLEGTATVHRRKALEPGDHVGGDAGRRRSREAILRQRQQPAQPMRVLVLVDRAAEQHGQREQAGLRQVGLHVEAHRPGGGGRRDAPVAPQLVPWTLQPVERMGEHVLDHDDTAGRGQDHAFGPEGAVGDVARVVQDGQAAQDLTGHLEAGARVERQQAVAGHLEDLGEARAGDVAGDEDRPAALAGRLEPEDPGELDVLELGEAKDALAQGLLGAGKRRIEVEPLVDLARVRLTAFAHTETVTKDHTFFRRFREVCYFHRARPFHESEAATITRIVPLVLQRPHQTSSPGPAVPSPCPSGGCAIGMASGVLHWASSAHNRATGATDL